MESVVMILQPVRWNVLRYFVLICFLGLCCITGAFAGRMVIKPHVVAHWTYEDNYFQKDTDERSASYWGIQPGIDFGYQTDKSDLMFSYNFSPLRFSDEDTVPPGANKAGDLDFVRHAGSLSASTRATDRVTLTLADTFHRSREPQQTDELSDSTDRSLFWTNTITPGFVYDFGNKYTFGAKYSYLVLDYKDNVTSEDSVQHRGDFTLGYNLNSSTSVNLNYQVWARDYDKTTSDYTSHQIMANVTKQFRVISLGAGLGYHNREFDQSGLDDMDSIAWNLSMSARFPKTSFNVVLAQNLNDSGAGNQYYVGTRASVGVNRFLTEKIDLGIVGFIQNSDYENSSVDQDLWGIDGTVGYSFNRYVSVGLQTGYEARDSNQSGADYDNYKVMLSATLNYDVGSR
jgi:polysaccharide biosynthesis protein VpsM